VRHQSQKKENADWPIKRTRSEGLGGLIRRKALSQLDQSAKETWVWKKASTRSNRGFFATKIENSTDNSSG
jgi:hypothetical protein